MDKRQDAEALRNVAAHYSSRAEDFARYQVPRLRPMGRRLVESLPLASARLVLDVGCGTGGLLGDIQAAAPDARVVGVDLSEGMLALARVAGPALAAMDAQRLGLRNGCADAVVMAFVLHRVPEPLAALAETARVLRPGGVIGTLTWSSGERSAAGAVLSEALASLGVPGESVGVDNHGLVDAPEKIRALLEAAGLTDVEAHSEPFEQQHTPDEWLEIELGWSARRSLALLDSAARATFETRLRERLAALPAGAFTMRSWAVLGRATRR